MGVHASRHFVHVYYWGVVWPWWSTQTVPQTIYIYIYIYILTVCNYYGQNHDCSCAVNDRPGRPTVRVRLIYERTPVKTSYILTRLSLPQLSASSRPSRHFPCLQAPHIALGRGGAKYRGELVCLFVCLSICLFARYENHMAELHQIFCA